jgi:hypothetical protein
MSADLPYQLPILFPAFSDEDTEDLPVPKPKTWKKCTRCNVEMSTTLDSYYGKSPYLGDYCSPCRWKHYGER